ncbi:class I SAM-dependent methyltransferase [Nocardioides anomalus]|uniref:Class I SAM-dependent methyltransferase n=1 Tax=Nocardioides anomalus TaxID=2712223 RepID=A0A6G6WKC6_9ACTN|nr:class I SAM-dependent methyltransferase [Nocardioides anomalus]QIG45520.1 class I SAM-dependent methyltransferase [Nocardioides anomalus]
MRALPGLGGWSEDPLWGSFYDWTVEHRTIGGAVWRVGIQSDLGLLYDAAAEIGRQRAGARVLDVPCGGGVAVRALRPGQGVDYVAVDISARMLERTARVAEEVGVGDQVTTRVADVERLPFDDQEVDLVVSFTGLHCFPDPARAVVELARVMKLGGVLTGSALMNDTGLRYEPMRRAGRLAGLLGPGCTTDQLRRWLSRQGVADVTVEVSGPMAYFRGVRRA